MDFAVPAATSIFARVRAFTDPFAKCSDTTAQLNLQYMLY